MSWYVLGIDNGLTGWACLYKIETREYKFIRTPVVDNALLISSADAEKSAGKTDYDPEAMFKVASAAAKVSEGACVAIIESTISTHTGGSGNATSNKSRESLIRGQTVWATVCRLAGIVPFEVAPASWQADMGLRGKTKDDAVKLAESFGVKVPVNTFPRKPPEKCHDAADAFLLARWFSLCGPVESWD